MEAAWYPETLDILPHHYTASQPIRQEELRDLYRPSGIVRIVKSKRP
jgi:hypothetical protein